MNILKILFFLLLITVAVSQSLYSQNTDTEFDELIELASESFENGEYEKAAELLERIIDIHVESDNVNPEFLRNVYYYAGLSFYLIDEFPKAYYHLQHSLKYAPVTNENNETDDYSQQALLVLAADAMLKISERDIDTEIPQRPQGAFEEIYFSIIDVEYESADTAIITIEGGSYDGLLQGLNGEIIGVYSQEFPDKGTEFLGSATLTEVETHRSIARVKLINPDEEAYQVQPGDVLNVTARTNNYAFETSLFNILTKRIQFTNNSQEVIAHYRQFLDYGDRLLEEQVIKAFQYIVFETEQHLSENVIEQFNTPLEIGRFEGLTLWEALAQTSVQDIHAFLDYADSFSGNYTGRRLWLSEIYADWVMVGGLPGKNDLLEELLIIEDSQELRDAVLNYRSAIEGGNYLMLWVGRSQVLADNGEYETATNIVRVLEIATDVLDSKEVKPWVSFSKAYVLKETGKTGEAIPIYQQAFELFEEGGNIEGQSYCFNNLAAIYSELNQHNKALEAYKKAYELKLKLFEDDQSASTSMSIALSLRGIGSSAFYLGDTNLANEMFERALQHYDEVNTTDAIIAKAETYNFMGRTYQRQGFIEQAIEYHTKERDLYFQIGNEELAADAIDWIAFSTTNSEEANRLYLETYEIKKRIGAIDNAAFSLSNAAQTFWQMGDFDKAVAYHEKAIEIREQTGNKSGVAYSWSKLGELYQKSGRITESFDAYEKASLYYQELGDALKGAELLEAIGGLYLDIEDYVQAENYYREAMKIYNGLDAKYEYGLSVSNLADVFYEKKEYKTAEELYRESIEIQRLTGDKNGLSYNLIYLGHINRYFRINVEQAFDYYNQALALSEETENQGNKIESMDALSRLKADIGDYDEAIEITNEIIRYYDSQQNRQESANYKLSLANMYGLKADFEKAEELFQHAYEVAKEFSNNNLLASSLSGIGELYLARGRYDEFMSTLLQTRSAYKEVENRYGLAGTYISSGNYYNLIGEYEKAIKDYQTSDSLYTSLKAPFFRGTPLNNTGNVYYMQGDFEKALTYFLEAYDINKVFGERNNFNLMIMNNLGDVNIALNNYDEATQWIDRVITISKEAENDSRLYAALRSRGNLKLKLDEYESAFEDLNVAYTEQPRTENLEFVIEITKLSGRALMKLGRMDEARARLTEARDLSERIGSRRYLWNIYGFLGELETSEGNDAEAVRYYKKSVEVIEYTRSRLSGGEVARQLFLAGEEKMQIYEAIVRLLMAEGNVEEAMAYAIKGNLENANSQIGMQYAGTESEALKEAQDIQLKISGLEHSLVKEKSRPENRRNNQLIQQLSELKTIAEENYLMYIQEIMARDKNLSRHLETTVNPNQLRANRRRIPNEMAVVQYLISANHLYIFVATSDSVFAREIPVEKQLIDEKAIAFYDLVKYRPSGNARTIGGVTQPDDETPEELLGKLNQLKSELYQLLIEPVLEQMEGRTHIAFIPNGTLNLIPFHALSGFGDGQLSVNATFSTFYNNDLSVFGFQMYDLDDIKMFAIGNADNTLPFAEEEVNMLASLFPGSEILVRGEATKNRLYDLSDEYNILHFATHGVLDFQVAENSFLVMAGDPQNGDNGHLTISDIYRIRNVENLGLVTLSACETAFSLESMIGWPVNTAIAFLNIGVPSVVATLWQVDDEATSLFMQYFYENISSMDKATALKEARMELASQEKFSHPYYWAAFTLMGDWR